jgi:two-component system, NarL family, nitrate/nitrite response regulator NarL
VSPPLRVRVATADPVRRRGFAAIIEGAGHRVVEEGEAADVVLADDTAEPTERAPLLTLGAIDSGQAGLLPADASAAQIAAALAAVAAGLVVRAAAAPRPEFRALAEPEAPLLTPREVEVLAAIGQGMSNKAAARHLGISTHTVKFHVESLFRKLGAGSRAEAVHKGLRQRLIEM